MERYKFDPGRAGAGPPLEETLQIPMFEYPEAVPLSFDQEYKGVRVKISLRYERLVKLGERPHIKVNLKYPSCCPIIAIWIRITTHDNVVLDVQPESQEIGRKRISEVVTTNASEKMPQRTVGTFFRRLARFMLNRGDMITNSNSTTKPDTQRSWTTMVTGERMRTFTDNDTAFWKIEPVKIPHGMDVKKDYEKGCFLNFSLLEMPYKFSYDCWVDVIDSDGRQQIIRKNLFGFWRKYKFQHCS